MKLKRVFVIALSAVTITAPVMTASAEAAVFTSSEKAQVRQIQSQYASLDKQGYTASNLYTSAPSLKAPFNPGVLNPNYIAAQVSYINYYRNLFGLPSVAANATDNKDAQIAASVMAAISASPFQNQHGLPGQTRPDFISEQDWSTAELLTNESNLNFNVANQSAGDVITDLLTDRYNLDGTDTGHRAWLLSTRLSSTGIGAAYGANGYRYSVQKVLNVNDLFSSPSKSTVAYPASGIFPIELLQGRSIAWSLYLSDQKVSGTPQITITDLDTGQKVQATNVNNYSSQGYGNFASVITYLPGNLQLVSGHQYQVSISGIYEYTFKLFNEIAANQPAFETPQTQEATATTPAAKAAQKKSKLLLEAEKLRDSLNQNSLASPAVFGRSYQDGKHYYNLGAFQAYQAYFNVGNPEIEAGIANIYPGAFDLNVYDSPYANLQHPTFTHIRLLKSYPYGQKIRIGNTTWYYLGPHKWIKQYNKTTKKVAKKVNQESKVNS